MKIYIKESYLLWEAMRRILHLDKYKDINTSFAGLGYPSEYRRGVETEFFKPSFKETPRVLNWYRLTDKGKKAVKYLIKENIKPKDSHDFDLKIPFEIPIIG